MSCKMENFPWGSSNLLTYCPLFGCPRPFVSKQQKGRKNSVREKVFNTSICTEFYEVHTYQVVESPQGRNFLAMLDLNNLKREPLNLVLLGGFLFRNYHSVNRSHSLGHVMIYHQNYFSHYEKPLTIVILICVT